MAGRILPSPKQEILRRSVGYPGVYQGKSPVDFAKVLDLFERGAASDGLGPVSRKLRLRRDAECPGTLNGISLPIAEDIPREYPQVALGKSRSIRKASQGQSCKRCSPR